MRLVGKPVLSKNGFPWVGVIKVLKDSTIVVNSKGTIWQAYGAFERATKDDQGSKNALWVRAYSPLSENLVEWAKGTMLLVAGSLHKDAYWSKKNGYDTYYLNAEFVAEQLDYRAMYGSTIKGSAVDGKAYEASEGEEEIEASDYNPDF